MRSTTVNPCFAPFSSEISFDSLHVSFYVSQPISLPMAVCTVTFYRTDTQTNKWILSHWNIIFFWLSQKWNKWNKHCKHHLSLCNKPSETLSSDSIQSTLSDTWRIVRLYPNNILPPSPPPPLSIVASTKSVYFDIHICLKETKI